MHFLITGHTGFKGAWLTLILKTLGHEVSGYSHDALPNSLYRKANLKETLKSESIADIRDFDRFKKFISETKPNSIIHLAAQPLVQYSYQNPRETFETNVMGTLNLLEIVTTVDSVESQILITTDKVYRNMNQIWGYREDDPLGGDDPYSSSKAMSDILIQSWVKSFPSLPPTAIARAGNVIGGGDISENRLMPDLVSSWKEKKEFNVRMPNAVRPWQHVLDCLNGYLLLEEAVRSKSAAGEWNFGPGTDGFKSVSWVVEEFQNLLGTKLNLKHSIEPGKKEALLLSLDSTKAELELSWRNKITVSEAIQLTIQWELDTSDVGSRNATLRQIKNFYDLKLSS
jgi:CDP-glucose 4,6-dehydratase